MSAHLSPRIASCGGVVRVRHARLRTLRLLTWQARLMSVLHSLRHCEPIDRDVWTAAAEHAAAHVALLEALLDPDRPAGAVRLLMDRLRAHRAAVAREDA